jgi:hypothetical protein
VVFVSGDVQGRRQGTWTPLDTGAALGRGDAVRVGAASECELRLADLAVVSIRANTEVELDSVARAAAGSQAKLGLTRGVVLAKVKKLGADDRFAIRTGAAIAGVRGTAFSVSVTPGGDTVVAVREGTVAVLPAAWDTDLILALSSTPAPELVQIVTAVQGAAVPVAAGRQITVRASGAALAATRFAAVSTAAAQIVQEQASGQAPSAETVTARTNTVQSALGGVSAATGTATAVAPAQAGLLRLLDRLPEPGAAAPAQTSSSPSGSPPAAAPPATAPAAAPAAAAAAPSAVHVTVSATPADAEIVRVGVVAGTGRYTADLADGTSITLLVRREGYATKTLSVQASAGNPVSYPVQLDPQPIETRFKLGTDPLVGSVVVAGDAMVAADGAGRISAVDRQGRILWTTPTQDAPNENSPPVAGPGTVAFTGRREFLVLDLRDRHAIIRTAPDSTSAHLFGQRVFMSDATGIFPTSTSLRIFDPRTGKTLHDFPIPGGTLMTPTLADGKIYAVSQAGTLMVVAADSGAILAQVTTPASQPVAISVFVTGTQAFFADRKGVLMAVDTAAKRVQ